MPDAEMHGDIEIQDEGSLVVLWLQTRDAEEWAAKHVMAGAMSKGPHDLIVERPRVRAILDRMTNAGLKVVQR